MSREQDREQKWQNILQLTDQLKQMTVREDWESMTELELERQQLLKDYFTDLISTDDAMKVTAEIEQIQQMMRINQDLINQGRAKQVELADAVQQLSTNRQAINAYQKVQDRKSVV